MRRAASDPRGDRGDRAEGPAGPEARRQSDPGRGFVASPLEAGLRIGGAAEFAGVAENRRSICTSSGRRRSRFCGSFSPWSRGFPVTIPSAACCGRSTPSHSGPASRASWRALPRPPAWITRPGSPGLDHPAWITRPGSRGPGPQGRGGDREQGAAALLRQGRRSARSRRPQTHGLEHRQQGTSNASRRGKFIRAGRGRQRPPQAPRPNLQCEGPGPRPHQGRG